SHALVLSGIALFDGQRLGPVLPVGVGNLDGDRRANRVTVAHAAQNVRGVALDLHATAAAITLLAPPELAVDEVEVNRHARRHAGEQRNQRLSVGLTGCRET